MIANQIAETLEKLPKDYALMVVFKLMADNHITLADIVNEHIDHLEKMRKVENEKMMGLQSRVVEMWCGHKKDWRENLKKCIRYLKDLGRINITDEQIDKF